MKKEQSFDERMQEYRESKDPLALYGKRKSQISKAKTNFSETDIQTIRQRLEKSNFKKNDWLEKKTEKIPMSAPPIPISIPQTNAVCFENLEIKLGTVKKQELTNSTKVEVTVFDSNGLDVIFEEVEIKEVIRIPLRKLKTGRYYWTININGDTKTKSFYHCSTLDAIILKDI